MAFAPAARRLRIVYQARSEAAATPEGSADLKGKYLH
jgi:hypothetical protein